MIYIPEYTLIIDFVFAGLSLFFLVILVIWFFRRWW